MKGSVRSPQFLLGSGHLKERGHEVAPPSISLTHMLLLLALSCTLVATLLLSAPATTLAQDFTTTPIQPNTTTATTSTTPSSGERVYSLSEILSESPNRRTPRKPRYCHGGRFAPCVCPKSVTQHIRYRPTLAECGGNAAAIASGKYVSSFSIVVRDRENRDRWPPTGFNGCTTYESVVLGKAKCSAFKAQSRFYFGPEKDPDRYKVYCFGDSGYSDLFKNASRLTVKLADIPNSTNDPIARLCLKSPRRPLN